MNNHLSITSFSIAIWNANGAKHKYIEISNFLHEHDIDVFVMTETHLSPDTRLNFANYNTFRTDRIHHRGGGSLILTKRAIDASLISTDREHGYETTTVRIKLTKYGAVNITSMYSPPDNRLDRSDLERLFPSNQKTLLAGDLNAKNIAWGCRRNNANDVYSRVKRVIFPPRGVFLYQNRSAPENHVVSPINPFLRKTETIKGKTQVHKYQIGRAHV